MFNFRVVPSGAVVAFALAMVGARHAAGTPVRDFDVRLVRGGLSAGLTTTPIVSRSGVVAFTTGDGVFQRVIGPTGELGPLVTVATAGQSLAGGLVGDTFRAPNLFYTDGSGRVLGTGSINGGSLAGVTAVTPTQRRLLVRSELSVPGITPALQLQREVPALRANPEGFALVRGRFNAPFADGVILTGTAAPARAILGGGSSPPGLPAGVVLQGVDLIALNGPGRFVMQGAVESGASGGLSNASGIWAGETGSAEIVPVVAPRARIGGASGPQFERALVSLAMNDAGTTAFWSTFVGENPNRNQGVVVVDRLGQSVVAAREGERGPGMAANEVWGSGSIDSDFRPPILTGSGRLLVQGSIRGPGVETNGLWYGVPGGLSAIARGGSIIDGITILGIGESTANARDDVVFIANYRLPGGDLSQMLCYWSAGGGLQPMVRTGDSILVAPGEARVVRGVSLLSDGFSSAGVQDGRGSPINDRGDLTFAIQWTDGTRSFWYTRVPAPGSAMVVMGAAMLAARRRRARPPVSGH